MIIIQKMQYTENIKKTYQINFIAILNTILFNICTLPVKTCLAMNTIVT
jgi:hypothetical protein